MHLDSTDLILLCFVHQSFELIFVSSDRTEKDFNEYHISMSFPALPFADRKAKEALSRHFKVQGIPTLVLLDATKNFALITDNGRGPIGNEATFIEDFPYFPKPVNDISTTLDGVNEEVSLIVLMEGAVPEAKASLRAALTAIATEQLALADDARVVSRFFTIDGSGGPSGRIRSGVGLADRSTAQPAAVILNLQDDGAVYWPAGDAAPTEASLRQFVQDYSNGALARRQFS